MDTSNKIGEAFNREKEGIIYFRNNLNSGIDNLLNEVRLITRLNSFTGSEFISVYPIVFKSDIRFSNKKIILTRFKKAIERKEINGFKFVS
jgi:hypothetical protein